MFANIANAGSLLVFALVFFGVIAIGAGMLAPAKTKRKWRPQRKYRPNRRVVPSPGEDEALVVSTEQLRTVMSADFKARPLLNKPEGAVFKALDAAVIARNPGWQVMAQVSLGEFLASHNKAAFLAVNSKRVDFALMDENCCVQHALEYQGKGHHQSSAAARDAVKKEALRKAGIGYHEIVAGHTTPSELRALVEKLVPGN